MCECKQQDEQQLCGKCIDPDASPERSETWLSEKRVTELNVSGDFEPNEWQQQCGGSFCMGEQHLKGHLLTSHVNVIGGYVARTHTSIGNVTAIIRPFPFPGCFIPFAFVDGGGL